VKPEIRAYIYREGGKIVSSLVKLGMARPRKASPPPEGEQPASLGEDTMITTQEPAKPPEVSYQGAIESPVEEGAPVEIATACVPCAVGHFSTSAGLLNEAVRFKGEGITSNEVLDRIAKALEEQNTLERVDLTPEKLQRAPEWERGIATEALEQSRKLRHSLEGITSIDELEQAASHTADYYKKLNRQWYKGRFAHLGKERVETIEKRLSSEDKDRIKKRAEALIEEA